jgi:hypothetical protein
MPKYGDTDPATGLVFVSRGRTYRNGEYWVTREAFEKRKESIQKKQKSKLDTDESFARSRKEKQRLRGQRPDVKKKRIERHKLNMETNPVYAIKFLTRMRLASLKKRTGKNKSQPSRRMLGADPWVCKKFIEDQFTDGMSWSNRGDWHIDHFFPMSLAQSNSEVRILSHFTNLRPLWSSENLKKSASPPHPTQMIERNNWIEKWINEKFQLQQAQNAEIGRIGTAPADMGGVQTQGMQQ